MYILVDEQNVIVACSNSEITPTDNGYLVDGVLYLDKHLEKHQSAVVTTDCIQKKCFCRHYSNCVKEDCPYYNECNQYVYPNKSYGDVCSRDGKELIVNQLKKIKPELDVSSDDIFPVIAEKIDTMLDDATVNNLNLGEGVVAYNGSGAVTGESEVIEQFDELPTPTSSDVGNIIKCGTSIYIGEEI